jgi:hypothetical protein
MIISEMSSLGHSNEPGHKISDEDEKQIAKLREELTSTEVYHFACKYHV